MKDLNTSIINSIRGVLCSLRQPKVRIIYKHLITFIPDIDKKLYMLKQPAAENFCWNYCSSNANEVIRE